VWLATEGRKEAYIQGKRKEKSKGKRRVSWLREWKYVG
jgi:hypothetical protein